jgi:hypothetical protein
MKTLSERRQKQKDVKRALSKMRKFIKSLGLQINDLHESLTVSSGRPVFTIRNPHQAIHSIQDALKEVPHKHLIRSTWASHHHIFTLEDLGTVTLEVSSVYPRLSKPLIVVPFQKEVP